MPRLGPDAAHGSPSSRLPRADRYCARRQTATSCWQTMPDRDVEAVRSRSKFVATLRRIADALESGEPVRIQIASKRVVVPQKAKLSIEHEREGRDEEVELQFSWRNAPPKAARAGTAAKRKK